MCRKGGNIFNSPPDRLHVDYNGIGKYLIDMMEDAINQQSLATHRREMNKVDARLGALHIVGLRVPKDLSSCNGLNTHGVVSTSVCYSFDDAYSIPYGLSLL